MHRSIVGLLLFTFVAAGTAYAATEVIAQPCENNRCPVSIPTVTPPAGWQIDSDRGRDIGITLLTRIDQEYNTSNPFIYAQALPIKVTGGRPLRVYIQESHAEHRKFNPTDSITRAAPVYTADRKLVETWLFSPKRSGRWRRVGYMIEGGFVIAFSVAANSAKELAASEASFEALIRAYRQ